jgi:hypothetical protein
MDNGWMDFTDLLGAHIAVDTNEYLHCRNHTPNNEFTFPSKPGNFRWFLGVWGCLGLKIVDDVEED